MSTKIRTTRRTIEMPTGVLERVEAYSPNDVEQKFHEVRIHNPE
jgi:hypothetical protein